MIATGLVGFLAGVGGAVLARAGRRLLSGPRCGIRLSAGWCEGAVALTWCVVGVRGWLGAMPWWWAVVGLLLGWAGVLLSACDIAVRRLPDVLTLPAYPVAWGLLLLGAGASGDSWLVPRAVAGGLLFAGTYAVIRRVSPGAVGAGDVKLAGSVGAVLGASSLSAVLLTMVSAAALSVVCGLVAGLRRAVPHGPAVVLPAWVLVVFATGGGPRGGTW